MPQAARICAVIGLHARTVQTVIEPERVNGKLVSVDAVFDELDGFRGRLEHTLTIRSSAFWVEHKRPVLYIHCLAHLLKALIEQRSINSSWERNATGSFEHFDSAEWSESRFARLRIEVHRHVHRAKTNLQPEEL